MFVKLSTILVITAIPKVNFGRPVNDPPNKKDTLDDIDKDTINNSKNARQILEFIHLRSEIKVVEKYFTVLSVSGIIPKLEGEREEKWKMLLEWAQKNPKDELVKTLKLDVMLKNIDIKGINIDTFCKNLTKLYSHLSSVISDCLKPFYMGPTPKLTNLHKPLKQVAEIIWKRTHSSDFP